MVVLSTVGAIVLMVAITLAAAGIIDVVQMIVDRERSAARAALRREYEAHLIDAEALARSLAAVDEAA